VNSTALQRVTYTYQGNSSEQNIEYHTWKGNLSHQADSLYIPGEINITNLQIICYTNTTYFVIKNFDVVKQENPTTLFNPFLFWIFLFILPWIVLAVIALKRIFSFRL